MSLFGSIYDENEPDDASAPSAPDPAPEVDVAGEPDEAVDTGDEAVAPVAEIEIDDPDMRLEDFAAEMFSGTSEDSTADASDDATVESDASTDEEAPAPLELETSEKLETPDELEDAEPETLEEPATLKEPATLEEPATVQEQAGPDPEPAPSGFSVLFDDADIEIDDPDMRMDEGLTGDAVGDTSSHVTDPGNAPGGGTGFEPRTPTPAGSLASAASDLADLAKSPVATMAPPAKDTDEDESDDDTTSAETFDDVGSNGSASDDDLEYAEPLVIDDLLPSSKPASGTALPNLSFSGGIPLKLIVVLFAAAVAGFVGIRMLSGDSGSDTGTAAGAAGGLQSPADALDAAQLAGAEASLRNATVAAAAEYANTGTFARSASEWGALVPEATVQNGTDAPPSQGIVSVVSDGDAACFETVLQNGATVAAGVTATTRGFSQDPGGASICTTDAAVIEDWSPSLSGL